MKRSEQAGGEPRWLDTEALATYICVRPDAVCRLVKQGRIPEPSRELGPRKPRWDRLAIDALFEGEAAPTNTDEVIAARVREILEAGPRRRRRDRGV